MSSQTSLVAKQYRLQTWAAQIQECQNRPAGMKVDEWCRQNDITKANYYYRLKRTRYLAFTIGWVTILFCLFNRKVDSWNIRC